MNDEQRILRVSVVATVTLAIAGSTAIVFEGIYSLADAAMTGLALGIARLIAASNAADASGGRLHERFTMGFWHLEPIVLGLILPPPVPAVPLSEALDPFAFRRAEAKRKRELRRERQALGLPDWRSVDAAVSAALTEVLRRDGAAGRIMAMGTAKGLQIDGAAVMRLAMKSLIARGCSRAAASRAVSDRLLER